MDGHLSVREGISTMFRKHSIVGLLFGIVFQIAFAMAVLAFIHSQMSQDPAAERAFPYVAAILWIFWTPFIIANCRRYIRDWKAEEAADELFMSGADRLRREAARERLLRKSWQEKGLSEEEQLIEERKERDRQNREWQERVTKEQRMQNERINREIEEAADRKRKEQRGVSFCSQCGAKLSYGARFCPRCGRAL